MLLGGSLLLAVEFLLLYLVQIGLIGLVSVDTVKLGVCFGFEMLVCESGCLGDT